jgi:hypothetical protein
VTTKPAFLCAYDYGQGAVWAYIHAASAEAITSATPDLEIIDPRPTWMSDDYAAKIADRMTFDLDNPHGWLKHLLEHPG